MTKNNKITCNLISLEAGFFKTEQDKEAFGKLIEDATHMQDGMVITPFYREEDGKLMSFLVDSKEAADILEKEGAEPKKC